MSTSVISASVGVQDEPLRHRLAPVDLVQQRGQRRRDDVDHVPLQRLVRAEVRRLAHCLRRPRPRCGRGSARASRSDAAASLITLRRRSDWMFPPLDVDRRRGADVRLRRHRQMSAACADPDACRRGARARRARRRRSPAPSSASSALTIFCIDVERPPGRVEHDHDRVVVVAVRAVDLVVDVVLRDRVHVVVELDGEDPRRARRPSAVARTLRAEAGERKVPARAAFSRCKDCISGVVGQPRALAP